MNKVKIMLTAITVFAVVGGALAFKAKKTSTIFCSTTQTFIESASVLENSTFTETSTGTSYCDVAGTTTVTLKAIVAKDN